MKLTTNSFKFCSTKIAQLKDYIYPATDGNRTKNNIIWLHGMFDSSKNFFEVV